MPRGMVRRLAVAVAALCLLLAVASCGSDSSSDGGSSTQAAGGGGTPSAALPESIRSSGVLKIASDIPFPPWEYDQGGTLVGFEVDLANAMARELGVRAEFVQLPFDSIIPALQAHKFPISLSAISDTRVRERVVDFVNYAYDDEAILVPKGNPKHIAGPDTFCGLRAAVTRGTIQADHFRTYDERCKSNGKPAIQIQYFQGDAVAQLTVRSGKSDMAPSDSAALSYVAKTVDGGDAFEVVTYEDAENVHTPVGVAMAKGQDDLRDAIEAALTRVLASPEYDQILEKYGLQSLRADSVTVNRAIS
jgi:polar amino acid transport system substrate-binding protein